MSTGGCHFSVSDSQGANKTYSRVTTWHVSPMANHEVLRWKQRQELGRVNVNPRRGHVRSEASNNNGEQRTNARECDTLGGDPLFDSALVEPVGRFPATLVPEPADDGDEDDEDEGDELVPDEAGAG